MSLHTTTATAFTMLNRAPFLESWRGPFSKPVPNSHMKTHSPYNFILYRVLASPSHECSELGPCANGAHAHTHRHTRMHVYACMQKDPVHTILSRMPNSEQNSGSFQTPAHSSCMGYWSIRLPCDSGIWMQHSHSPSKWRKPF